MTQQTGLSIYQEDSDGNEKEVIHIGGVSWHDLSLMDATSQSEGMLQVNCGANGEALLAQLQSFLGSTRVFIKKQNGLRTVLRVKFFRNQQVFFDWEFDLADCALSMVPHHRLQIAFGHENVENFVHSEVLRWIRLWQQGRPSERYWAPLHAQLQHLWMAFHLRMHAAKPQAVRNKQVVLDGRFIRNKQAFYCEFSEQLCGVGGYAGYNLDALEDCLSGGWFADFSASELQVTWQHFTKSQQHLSQVFIGHIRDVFQSNGVTLVLEAD